MKGILQQYHEKSSADFAAAARSAPENAEAHTGLGYVQGPPHSPPDAQREADLALLHGAGDYLVLHNVACIYAALSQAQDVQANAYQDVSIALLRQALKLWKKGATGPIAPPVPRRDDQEHRVDDRPAVAPIVVLPGVNVAVGPLPVGQEERQDEQPRRRADGGVGPALDRAGFAIEQGGVREVFLLLADLDGAGLGRGDPAKGAWSPSSRASW